MKKYFYLKGNEKKGPFSIGELQKQNITRETYVWYYGLDKWTTLSEVDELKFFTNSIPPQLKITEPTEIHRDNPIQNTSLEKKTKKKSSKNKNNLRNVFTIITISLIVLLVYYITLNKKQNNILYQEIASSAYETDVDFDFYVDKFYRDIGIFGIFPKKPITKIIKFAKFDYIDNATHYHGISYGKNDDDRIEIYINQSTWDEFNKPMRYYLMYHELSHDVLNVYDLEDLPLNEGKLMFPAIATYESKTMDDFIESSHEFFEEVAYKQ
ncbi:DUF4339 domain-containing protein [Candidatus Neomarinimicrobiota bacterium]